MGYIPKNKSKIMDLFCDIMHAGGAILFILFYIIALIGLINDR